MQTQKYIIFYYYYINSDKEVDKILKKKYILQNDNMITHKELFSEILNHKSQYTNNISLHEILLYENTYDPEVFCNDDKPPTFFKHINPAYDISLNENPLNKLTCIYVFFKTKSYKSKTKKNKKSLV